MTTVRRLLSGGPARGAPVPGRPTRRSPIVFVLLALAGWAQTGCQSDPCGPSCGRGWRGFSTWGRDFRERTLRPFRRQPCCDGGAPVIGGAVVSEGATLEMGSAPIVTPAPGSAAPSSSASPPSSLDSNPQMLEEAPPKARPGPSPDANGTTGSKSSTGKANYEAYLPGTKTTGPQSSTLARTDVPSLEPTPRARVGPVPATGSNPLDNLPPLELPKDVDNTGEAPPTPTPVGSESPSVPVAKDKDRDKDKPIATPTEAAPAASASVPPQINLASPKRFCVVAAKLAGGSVPDADALDWLVEKGYKTLVDLREPAEVKPEFIAAVTNQGLRYLPLPLNLKTVDAAHVYRFHDELSRADARPLYFFDTDGSRPGVLWYIRRIAVDKVDGQIASREAEALGLTDQACWDAASAYLDTLKPAPARTDPADDPKPKAPDPTAPPAAEQAAADTEPDPTAWRSYAGLIVTGLGVPLAYWSASALPTFRLPKRASLTGPGRGPKSLPRGSDV